MKLEEQVISLEYAKKLKELGVKQESLFWWDINNQQLISKAEFEWGYDEEIENIDGMISAYTVAELGEMLPALLNNKEKVYYGYLTLTKYDKGEWEIAYNFDSLNNEIEIDSSSLATGLAKMLIHLLENNLIKLEDINGTK